MRTRSRGTCELLYLGWLVLGLGCGGSVSQVTVTEPQRASAPAPERFTCTVESWAHEELGRATGAGATPAAAHADAARRLCAGVSEPCPSDELMVVFVPGEGQPDFAGPPDFAAGVTYRLVRRTYALHHGESTTSRANACAAAERAFRATDGPAVRAVAGVDGLRWSDALELTRDASAAALEEAVAGLRDTSSGRDSYECELKANVTPVLWQREVPGAQADACLDAAPRDVRSHARQTTTDCRAGQECTARCALLGEARPIRVEGTSSESRRAACLDAVRRFCPGAKCQVELTRIDGLDVGAFTATTPS